MSTKVTLQELSISKFDQHLDVTEVKGGGCRYVYSGHYCVLWVLCGDVWKRVCYSGSW